MLLSVSESTSESPGECVLWPPCHLEWMLPLQPIYPSSWCDEFECRPSFSNISFLGYLCWSLMLIHICAVKHNVVYTRSDSHEKHVPRMEIIGLFCVYLKGFQITYKIIIPILGCDRWNLSDINLNITTHHHVRSKEVLNFREKVSKLFEKIE